MAKKEIAFEKALEELQGVVNALEAGKVGLDESLGLYERGMELVRLCNARLDEAEQRVLAVQKNEQGEAVTVPFAAEEK